MSRDWDDSGGDYLTTSGSPTALNIITANGPYSMAIFGNMDNTTDEITPLAKYSGFGPIIRIVSKKVRFFTVNSGVSGVEAIGATDTTPGTWQLYGGAWDGSSVMRVTLDGVEDGTASMGAQFASSAADWRIGLRNDNAFPFNGLIYYVAIWDSYLTDQQWLDLAAGDCPDTVDPTNLVGFWILEGNNPEVDLSGNGNDVSLTGTAPFDASEPTTDCNCDAPVNDGGTGLPVISGTALEGSTLTVDSDGAWTGTATITFTYQWYRLCGTVEELITGETASTYVATIDDVGCNVFVEVTGTNGCGSSTADSNQIGPIASCPVPSNPGGTSAPVLTGSECVGDLVTVTDGDWFDVDSMTTYAYEWERVCGTVVETIGGETASTYTLDVDDVGCDVRCVVTATNACGSASETSNEIGPVNDVPSNTVPPVISGVPAVGHTLETTDGTWLNAGAFTYKWQRDCGGGFVDILGETAATYLITVADVGCYLRSVVTTTNACG